MQAAAAIAAGLAGKEIPQTATTAPENTGEGSWRSFVPMVRATSPVSFWAPLVGIQGLSMPDPASFSAQA
ncbi:MAG: hypothetical protein IMW91_03500 [Firmicutes bacterium]|nr:hypothetical protein [Bacillota bacterium]